jgi:hypothetical protein
VEPIAITTAAGIAGCLSDRGTFDAPRVREPQGWEGFK